MRGDRNNPKVIILKDRKNKKKYQDILRFFRRFIDFFLPDKKIPNNKNTYKKPVNH